MKNILLIEHDEWLMDCYQQWLKQHKLKWARDAGAALDLLDEYKIDVIILDIFLSFSNGMQILNVLASHADFFKIPIIVLSIDPPEPELLHKYGVKYVLNKTTITQAGLNKVIDALL